MISQNVFFIKVQDKITAESTRGQMHRRAKNDVEFSASPRFFSSLSLFSPCAPLDLSLSISLSPHSLQATFNLKPQRDLVISDLPEDLIDYIFKLAELHRAEGGREKRGRRGSRGTPTKNPKKKNSLAFPLLSPNFPFTGTGDRVRCAAVCREWASILSAPCYWRELQLDTADFDGRRLHRQQQRRQREVQRRRVEENAESGGAPSSALAPSAHVGLLHHHLDRAPADAGARAAFADALLALAERAGGALERVRVVSARASGVDSGGGGGVFGGGDPRGDGGGALALLDDEAEELVEDERGAGTSRRSAAPRLFYGDGVSLEPFPGSRVGFCGAGRELEAWLSATASKLAELSFRSSRAAAEGEEPESSDSDDSLIAAVGVFGAGDADALARAERVRAEAAAYRERMGASARLQAALCGKPFGGKHRFPGGSGGGRRRNGGGGRRGRALPLDETQEPLASWAFRVGAYLCFRAFRGALRGVLRWRRGRGAGSSDGSHYLYSGRSCRRPSSSGTGAGQAAIDGALALAAVALAARLLVTAFALPALVITAAKGALSLVAAAAAAVAAP